MLFLLEDGREHSVEEIAAHLGLSLPAASRAVEGLIQRDLRSRLQTLESFAAGLTPDERDARYTALLPIVVRITP